MADDEPQLLQPKPRRPFDLNLMSTKPPESPVYGLDSVPSSSSHLSALWDKLDSSAGTDASPLSRPASFMNLTSSTLYGIFSPNPSSRDRIFSDREEPTTPFDTGSRTPFRRPDVDEATFELIRERARPSRRRLSRRLSDSNWKNTITPASLALRTALLFVLGLGYGVIVTRLHDEQNLVPGLAETIITSGHSRQYLAFWGISGVLIGSLLPWVDKVWEETSGADDIDNDVVVDGDEQSNKDTNQNADWNLVIRAIGAFVGIAFAIRKLSWDSSLQISITLALVNPLLWWLIDRSIPGFLLSAFVGLTGSALLLGINPEMMPAPPTHSMRNGSMATQVTEALTLGGMASQKTLETGIWMLSVLFCSCICFGNIGRRLTWGKLSLTKGRWAGLQ